MLIVRKTINAAELFWSSLDEDERIMVAYAAAWLVATVAAVAARANRERLKREILVELAGVG